MRNFVFGKIRTGHFQIASAHDQYGQETNRSLKYTPNNDSHIKSGHSKCIVHILLPTGFLIIRLMFKMLLSVTVGASYCYLLSMSCRPHSSDRPLSLFPLPKIANISEIWLDYNHWSRATQTEPCEKILCLPVHSHSVN